VQGGRISPDGFVGDALALRNGPAFFPTLKAGFTYRFTSPVEVPTTVAWGARDKVLLFGQSALAQERLPDARHIALPRCGHVPMIDDPDLIVRVIEDTVQKTPGETEEAA
jgi:pimeloyl-ACP methyl ester carboxylesterase